MDINSEKLKSLRDEKLWSQDELAIASGLSLRTIQRAEREGVASLQTVKAMAAALNIDLSLLRREAADRSPEVQSLSEAQPSVEAQPRLSRVLGLGLVVVMCIAVVLVLWYQGQQEQSSSAPDAIQADTKRVTPVTLPGTPAATQTATQTATQAVTQTTARPTAKLSPANELAAKLHGHWESISTGIVMTVDIDGTTTRFGGEGKGSSSYTLMKDVISYGFGNQIISARIKFDSPKEMTWTTLETGTTFKWTRDNIVPPSREEVLGQLQGSWRGLGFVRSLEVDAGKMKLVFMDDSRVDSAYLINQQRISVNRAGTMQHYIVSFDSPTEMTWSRVFGLERYAFVRIPSQPN